MKQYVKDVVSNLVTILLTEHDFDPPVLQHQQWPQAGRPVFTWFSSQITDQIVESREESFSKVLC